MRLSNKWFYSKWKFANSQATNRYSEILNIDTYPQNYIYSITQDAKFFNKFDLLRNELTEIRGNNVLSRLNTSKFIRQKGFQNYNNLLKKIADGLQTLSICIKTVPSKIDPQFIIKDCVFLYKKLNIVSNKINERSRMEPNNKDLDYLRYDLLKLQSQIHEIKTEMESSLINISNKPYVLLTGPAGAGKTHLLCEITRYRVVDKKLPALILFGQSFQNNFKNIEKTIVANLGITDTPNVFFKKLNKYSIKRKTRCLICIDAINEGNRNSWKREMKSFIEYISQFPGIAIVISCRSPFDSIIIPEPNNIGLSQFTHYGYLEEEQTNAIEKYFSVYGIPLPEIPEISPEFSNPLFLKLFCEAMEKVSVKKKHTQIKNIASGQMGMTHLLEFLVRQKYKIVRRRIDVDCPDFWRSLKEGLAAEMATKKVDILKLTEARKIINNYQPIGMRKGVLLREMLNEDILSEDVIFKNGKPVEAIRFSYQKFADHLIARYLLLNFLDNTNNSTIKSSLKLKTRLGKYFCKSNNSYRKYYGIIQALILEFPNRIGNKGELFDFLGWKMFPIDLCRTFIECLYWRDSRCINNSTKRWIVKFLECPELKDDILSVLISLSVKTKHPLNAKSLDRYLSKMELTKRDIFWTEYLRVYYESHPHKILYWAKIIVNRKVGKKTIKLYLIVLSWFLTSTHRSLRDKATHILFLLGIKYPDLVFRRTIKSLELNDPYIQERMLAVCYGITMALWKRSSAKIFRNNYLPFFCRGIYEGMFSINSRYPTTHIFTREYAWRTLNMLSIIKPNFFSKNELKRLKPPFKSQGIINWKMSNDRDEDNYKNGNKPLGMDFENYTIGKLVNNRRNYDYSNKTYQRIRKRILWRIYNLGYKLDDFAEIDKIIARSNGYSRNNEAGKTERYGKKYAWIGYYELAGWLDDRGQLPKRYFDNRLSDADIDPSFPENESYDPIFSESIITHNGDLKSWMKNGGVPYIEDKLLVKKILNLKGPWVLLDGFVDKPKDEKNIFIFFRGLVVKKWAFKKAVKILREVEYPGNSFIPDKEEEYYTYAGEIPWSDVWSKYSDTDYLKINNEKVKVEIPSKNYSWESYHSTENNYSGGSFLSKEIASNLGLYINIPKVSFKEEINNKKGVLVVESGEVFRNKESLLFIRIDLLKKYLERKNSYLLMFAWGERQGSKYEDMRSKAIREMFTTEEIIHKQLFVFKPKNVNFVKLF